MTEPTPVLLVDLSSIGHPIWHVSQAEPDPDYTSQRTAAIVRKLAADHPHTAICCDACWIVPKGTRRPTYKANRPVREEALAPPDRPRPRGAGGRRLPRVAKKTASRATT